MEQKDKAFKIAFAAVGVLALAMVVYYWAAWRTRKTDSDVSFQEKGEANVDAVSEFAGLYALSEPVEGMNRRLVFFTVSKKDDGSGGFFGSAKLDAIASTTEEPIYLQCPEVKIAEKEFFIKCHDENLGQISFVGEWNQAPGAGIQVLGKVMWSKDVAEVTSKSITLTHSAGT